MAYHGKSSVIESPIPNTVSQELTLEAYIRFLEAKMDIAKWGGWAIDRGDIHPSSKPHQVVAVEWATRIGRGLIAMSFGLGKSQIAIELAKLVTRRTGGIFLIVAPLGVRHHFIHVDGPRLGTKWQYVTTDADIKASSHNMLITNYERVRDGDIDPRLHNITGVILDEGSVLRSLGSKTYDVFGEIFAKVPYRWVATATPSPNNFREILGYADFLGVMDRGEALTRFFQRNVDKAGDLTLIPSQEENFWMWVASWALFLFRPSDLGFSDEGYDLPKLNIHWHRVPISYNRDFGIDSWGQYRMLPDTGGGIQQAMKEKRDTIESRLAKAIEIINEPPDRHFLLWHHLEAERKAIEKHLPEAVTVYGSQKLELSEQHIIDFTDGKFRILATKPKIAGSGCNFQRYCSDAIFLGVDYKFQDIIQAVHRIYRFQQVNKVNIHFIYAESEDEVVNVFKQKWTRHDYLTEKMRRIVREYGLTHWSIETGLRRSIIQDDKRTEEKGRTFTAVKNDSVLELFRLVDLMEKGELVSL